jgi:hypothetical protein
MDYIKSLGKFGLIIATIVFIVTFVQTAFNSNIIRDSVEYNLLYSYEFDETDAILSIGLRNNGIKTLENIRLYFRDNRGAVNEISLQDTVNFSVEPSNKLILKDYTITYNNNLYPLEYKNLLIVLHKDENNKINLPDFSLFVSCMYTNGIKVNNAYTSKNINYENLNLYINGIGKLLWLTTLKIVFPIFATLIILVLIGNVLMKNRKIRKTINYLFGENDRENGG